MLGPIGYYPFMHDPGVYLEAACPACHALHGAGLCVCCEPYRHDDSEPIWDDTESDTPTHCWHCEALILHGLTPDGYAYVAEALAFGGGRPEILAMWRDAYGDVEVTA